MLNIFATFCFALAVLQTFFAKQIREYSHRFAKKSFARNFFHHLGEIELIFVFWALLYLLGLAVVSGVDALFVYLQQIHFQEPIFVFVIMSLCATKPVLKTARFMIMQFDRVLPFQHAAGFLFSLLFLGPLLGSLITEPAAMTVCALLLAEFFANNPKLSLRLKYALLGLLFVNISLGGTLTHFAAPPVVMVARVWNWDSAFMFWNFGWKAVLTNFVSTAGTLFFFRAELAQTVGLRKTQVEVPFQIRSSLLVALFLAGLVVLGTPQSWWLNVLLAKLSSTALYFGAAALTSVTDNAALTFLGAQSGVLSELGRYALVAGSVVGGGLTVIANAPNPIGYTLLSQYFGDEGISAKRLFFAAFLPTLLAFLFFWLV